MKSITPVVPGVPDFLNGTVPPVRSLSTGSANIFWLAISNVGSYLNGRGVSVYEGFFGLSKRPFSAVPNPDSFVGFEPAREALDALLTCITQARGIAVMTSAAGLGKTLLCKRLAEDAESQFQSIYLSTSAFSTRRALLQAILYEFGVEYEGLTEQEARLKILEASRAIAADGRLLLILVDEAHLLNNRLFEELRGLTDYAPDGEALIRLVLSGQFELEEKLTDPALSAVNQRIGCQICLEPLSFEQSAELLVKKLEWAGAEEIESIITDSALEAICRASDGNPRCLCQLADHSFLLAFAEEEKPISRNSVVAALDDLKELPLHWNDLPDDGLAASSLILDSEETVAEASTEPNEFETEEFEIPDFLKETDETRCEQISDFADEDDLEQTKHFDPSDENEIEYSVIEVGAELKPFAPANTDDDEQGLREESVDESDAHFLTLPIEKPMEMQEETVVDKFAELDRAVEHNQQPTSEKERPGRDLPEWEEKSEEVAEVVDERELLETVESLRREIGSAVDESKERFHSRQKDRDLDDWQVHDVVQPEPQLENEPQERTTETVDVAEPAEEANPEAADTVEEEPSHRFAQLFTRLSQRRRQILQQRNAK
ncbi:ExeA family protein [Thalassoglobus polymorphus]|uniref:AAA+ ATPase domain-containing protein n=1 Tax=Thalassoglobus polymorphus TaxID=2527994 RepID=A0A517QR53_9PLAN|nr:AAA family ATPase [Thalassoglobus polymorphus]QDT34093.1 hypothetical protein Mal48_33530 [Thalassoglobus polymorphus]